MFGIPKGENSYDETNALEFAARNFTQFYVL